MVEIEGILSETELIIEINIENMSLILAAKNCFIIK